MGRAARAKESRGNPTREPLTRRIIDAAYLDRLFTQHPDAETVMARFSDRTYRVDRNGTLRRAPVEHVR